jgi:hypothetical protein
VAPVDGSLLRVLQKYGFELDESGARWRFEGHESQCCTVELGIEDAGGEVVYRLSIEAFPGGEGFEDETRYSASQQAQLERVIERTCEDARQPYVKTRLQRLFEPFLGHDMAWALFGRARRR